MGNCLPERRHGRCVLRTAGAEEPNLGLAKKDSV
jgi:hypothetical protein